MAGESLSEPFEIALNGERHEVGPGETVITLLESLTLDPRTVAVEFNGEILPRDHYAGAILAGGDRIEIVHFVQGG